MTRNYQSEVLEILKEIDFDGFNYQIELCTNHGRIRMNLMTDVAPGHCANIIGLAKVGFYNGLTFHRIIDGFMIQGGCPAGTGIGGPGYNIDAEFNATPHVEGIVSMARTPDPNSAGSQFFICLDAQPSLDNQYTAFARVTADDSLDVVRKIGALKTDMDDRPTEAAIIESANVIASPV